MLLIGAGLLMKSLWHLWHVDPGFNAANVLGMRISVPEPQYAGPGSVQFSIRQVIDRIRALPGVEGVAATNDLPFSGSRTSTSFDIDGVPSVPGESRDSDYRTVSSGYFRVMRIPVLKGRAFTGADNRPDTPRVAIINDALLRRYWPARIQSASGCLHEKPYEIVGVIGNVRHDNLTAADAGEIYVPQYARETHRRGFSRDPQPYQPSIADSGHTQGGPRSGAGEPVYDIRTMQERLSKSIAPQRFNALALAVFASFALLLATIGIYGVVAFAAERRTHEIGIRMAVGAQSVDVLRLIVRQGLTLGLLGVAIGVAGALAISRIVASMLYATGADDPLTYLVVSVTFLAIATIASYVPARRAATLDPMVALRWE